MLKPGHWPLRARRWVPFVELIPFVGIDFTGATFVAQVRLYPDAPGDPLISLANAAANAQGVSVSVTFDDDGLPTSWVQLRINETTIEDTLPFTGAGHPGRDVTVAWDLIAIGGGYPKSVWLEGPFNIAPGVSR